jgi:hypothetical protein
MDAYDTKHVTNNFKYMGDIKLLEEDAVQYRKNVDAVILTPEEIAYFDKIKSKFVTKKD